MVYHPRHAHADFLLDPAWQDVLLGAVEGLLAQGEEAGAASESEQTSAGIHAQVLGAAAAEPAEAEGGAARGVLGGSGAATTPSLEDLLAGDGGVDGWRRFLEAAAGGAPGITRASSGTGVAAATADGSLATARARRGGLVVTRKHSSHQLGMELLAAQLGAGSSAAAGEASARVMVPRRHTLPVAAPSHLLDAATISSEVAGILRRASELSQMHD